jgi:hypothetical protein
MKRNAYTEEDRIVALAMYRNKKLEIGLFDIKRIAQITGHSAASFSMKVDQFKGIAGPRHKKYVEDRDDNRPGLNEWAAEDERIWSEFGSTVTADLNILAKQILINKFETHKEK